MKQWEIVLQVTRKNSLPDAGVEVGGLPATTSEGNDHRGAMIT